MDVDSLLASLEEETARSPSPVKKLENLQLQDVDALLEEMDAALM